MDITYISSVVIEKYFFMSDYQRLFVSFFIVYKYKKKKIPGVELQGDRYT